MRLLLLNHLDLLLHQFPFGCIQAVDVSSGPGVEFQRLLNGSGARRQPVCVAPGQGWCGVIVVISVDVVRGHFPICRDDLTGQPVQFSPEEDLGLFELGFLLVHLPEQMHKADLSDPLCQFGVFFLDLVEMLENDPDIRMIIDLVGHFTFVRLTGLRVRPVSSEELLVLAQLVLEMSTDLTLDVSS
ncbi:MAG: hypothetical protein QF768_20150, partial [Candidatus Latescibacteria bacterium]|nr:hypothetical protein [Candidatus Latescibacterota bacterium]